MLGRHLWALGSGFYNPDEVARVIRSHFPELSLRSANSAAWRRGFEQLQRAIDERKNFAFETTLSSSQITGQLIRAAETGSRLSILYVGLQTLDLHAQRVDQRRQSGGHHIPLEDITRRFEQSPKNLATLVPYVTDLVVFDNSEAASGDQLPSPAELLRIADDELVFAVSDDVLPGWALQVSEAVQRRFAD